MFSKIFPTLILITLQIAVFSQNLNNKIELSQSQYNIKELLYELENQHHLKLAYNSQILESAKMLKLSERVMSLKSLLEQICRTYKLQYVVKNNQIFLTKTNDEKKFSLGGYVIDKQSGESLPAASILINPNNFGCASDSKGYYSFRLDSGVYNINCRYMGYKEKTMCVHLISDQKFDILMELSDKQIQEVKITDHFKEPDAFEIGRSIETIKGKTVAALNTNNVNDALHGRVNGVWSTKVSGAPGDHSKIRIRGISSIFASTDPLYVVDGMIIPVVNFNTLGIAEINTHDVESIIVLKDAAATALYGFLGGSGVILIETKKGGGETKFNFNVKQGLQQFNKRYGLMNSEQFYSTLALADNNIETPFYTVDSINGKYEFYPNYTDTSRNTLPYDDFQEELFRIGNINEYQLSSQGEIKGINYYMSGNYFNHNGVITNTNYNKYSFAGNFGKIIGNNISLNLQYRGSHQENRNNLDNYMGNDVILKGINYEPAVRATVDSFLVKNNRYYFNSDNDESVLRLKNNLTSPYDLFNTNSKKEIENTHSIGFNGSCKINEQFSTKATISMSFRNKTFSSYLAPHIDNGGEKFLQSTENIAIVSQQYDAIYKKSLNKHNFDAFVRFRNHSDNIYWEIDSIYNINTDAVQPESDVYVKGSMSIFGEKGSVLRTINSFIANFNYNYNNKYFISLLANYDHLKEGHWVNSNEIFPSLALCYDLAREARLGFPEWIDNFKISANYGQVGNYPLNSLSNDIFSESTKYDASGNIVPIVHISNLANHKLTHEQISEINFGSEISLLKNRIIFKGDYYRKQNANLLIMRELPYYHGGGFTYDNIGEMKSSGIELSLEMVPFQSDNFYWNTKFGISSNQQRITKLIEGDQVSFNRKDILFPDFYARENETLGDITGFSCLGPWNDSIATKLKADGNPMYVQSSGMAYAKHDTVWPQSLAPEDKTIIGNSIPQYTLNWINYFQYKNFACEMLWYGSLDFDKYNATKASTYITGINNDVAQIVADTMKYITRNQFYESSFFVEDASFLRLKTLSFTYIPPKKINNRVGMEFKLSFENLITITRYSGYDPEATIYTNNNFTDNAVDKGSYPNPRGAFLSINLKF